MYPWLNTLYSEELIHPDFFTIDKTAARALYTEGAVPVLCDAAPYLSLRTDLMNLSRRLLSAANGVKMA